MAAFGKTPTDLVERSMGRAFTDDELKGIFDPKTFVPWAMKRPQRWWVPILCLYTGARVTEIAQLKLADVIQEHGTWCLWIRKTTDVDQVEGALYSRQTLKGKASIRKIPVPQPVIDAGFLDFVEDMKALKHPRLFPHLSAGQDLKTGLPNGKGYGCLMISDFKRHLQKMGIAGKQIAFHAFRHYFITSLVEAGEDPELIATITGHAARKTVPVLQNHYVHVSQQLHRQQQVAAMAKLAPPVKLPRYKKGQFKGVNRTLPRFP
jgi:integrase